MRRCDRKIANPRTQSFDKVRSGRVRNPYVGSVCRSVYLSIFSLSFFSAGVLFRSQNTPLATPFESRRQPLIYEFPAGITTNPRSRDKGELVDFFTRPDISIRISVNRRNCRPRETPASRRLWPWGRKWRAGNASHAALPMVTG